MRAVLILPDQLFERHPALTSGPRKVVLLEHRWYYFEHAFHAKRLVLLRAAMRAYADELREAGHDVDLFGIDAGKHLAAWRQLEADGVRYLELIEPHDRPLLPRLRRDARRAGITLALLRSPGFLSPTEWLAAQLPRGQEHYSMARFYAAQRRRMGLLITDDGGPIGGKWSFDPENRRRLPRGHVPPTPWRPPRRTQTTEAIRTVAELFPRAPGVELLQEPSADESASSFEYPVTRADARKSLQDFLDNRLPLFGDYEDAISTEHRVMYHSVITPALNIGLLTPEEVVSAAMARADEGDVPLNSLEGFVRQVIGWREFMHGAYLAEGRSLRAANELGHTGRMPPSFYEGTTGLEPFDATVTRLRRHGWCHHIERLMVLGNLMLLCEIEPAAVFRWFMEYFVDAHDWVMVPNVFGMSQFADGGTLTTKPYVSGSAYLRRMSDYPDGPWRDIWDGLYWRWVRRHRELLESIPRSRVAVRGLERLDRARERRLRRAAEEWLEGRAG